MDHTLYTIHYTHYTPYSIYRYKQDRLVGWMPRRRRRGGEKGKTDQDQKGAEDGEDGEESGEAAAGAVQLITKSFVLKGKLFVHADAGLSLDVTVLGLSTDGGRLQELGHAHVRGTKQGGAEVKWRCGDSCAFADQPVQLRFAWKEGALYGFELR
jgi:hypothetical protein